MHLEDSEAIRPISGRAIHQVRFHCEFGQTVEAPFLQDQKNNQEKIDVYTHVGGRSAAPIPLIP